MGRRIGVVTGARAEYGYLKALINEIIRHPQMELLLYVTGLHLVREFGDTLQEIMKDGFKITKIVDMEMKPKNTDYDMAISVGKGVMRFADAFIENRPEILTVFGDRIEALAAVVVAASMNIPIAHIGGGEVGLGDIDDNIRHAITKFAHLHFTSSQQSMERVLKLGEESWRVFHAGALSLDTILKSKLLLKKDLSSKYSLPYRPFILVCYHPLTTQWQQAEEQMKTVMAAVAEIAKEENIEIVIIYPSAYPGGHEIVDVIREYGAYENTHVFSSIPHLDYLSLMSQSSVLVGNSSSGIIEAPSLGIPYVCIGARQEGRERASNVIDVACEKEAIAWGIKKALSDEEFLGVVKKCESPYGDGSASKRIVDVLSKVKIDEKLLQKRTTY
jgi:GDP/UDP-N,N'-diacetylbacillosamine 2-epimerase (hydrolysing)